MSINDMKSFRQQVSDIHDTEVKQKVDELLLEINTYNIGDEYG